MVVGPKSSVFYCPLCLRRSFNLHDIEAQYCTCCGGPYLPKYCEHDPDGRRIAAISQPV